MISIQKKQDVLIMGVIVVVFLSALFVIFSISYAQIFTPNYPIAELGDCTDRADCANYCDDINNVNECVQYSLNNGLITPKGAQNAKILAQSIASSTAPGGCNSFGSCTDYCDDINNLSSCLSFLGGLNVTPSSTSTVQNAQRINNFLNTGGSTPGNCTSAYDCSQYCSKFSNFKECAKFSSQTQVNFIKNAASNNLVVNTMQVVSNMYQNGQTPGGCGSKSSCASYCSRISNTSSCLSFINKVGQTVASSIGGLGGGSSGSGSGSGSGSSGGGSGSQSQGFGGLLPGGGNSFSGGGIGNSGSSSGGQQGGGGSGSGSGSGSSGGGSGSGSSGGSGSGSFLGGNTSSSSTSILSSLPHPPSPKSILGLQKCIDKAVQKAIQDAINQALANGDPPPNPKDVLSPKEADEIIKDCVVDDISGQKGFLKRFMRDLNRDIR